MMNINELKKKYKEEEVFVVPFEKVAHIKDGFTKDNDILWSKFDSDGLFIKRYDAEGNPLFQQIIPYVIIKNMENEFFVTERLKGDSRLIGSLSIGVGGHINPIDGNKEVIFYGAARELIEEVKTEYLEPFKAIGYIRGLTSKTNDHLGVVLELTSLGEIEVNEKDVLRGSWMSLDELVDNYTRIENWGQVLVDHYVTAGSK